MATKWCPQCHAEYRDGFAVCADCGVALVDSLAARPETHRGTLPEQPSVPFLPGDDVVELARLPTVEAELAATQLRAAGIPAAVFGTGPAVYTGVRQARLVVRRSDLGDADRFVEQLSADARSGTPISDEELVALAEESQGGYDPTTGAVV
jgi:hypothetical protein